MTMSLAINETMAETNIIPEKKPIDITNIILKMVEFDSKYSTASYIPRVFGGVKQSKIPIDQVDFHLILSTWHQRPRANYFHHH